MKYGNDYRRDVQERSNVKTVSAATNLEGELRAQYVVDRAEKYVAISPRDQLE